MATTSFHRERELFRSLNFSCERFRMEHLRLIQHGLASLKLIVRRVIASFIEFEGSVILLIFG